MGVLWNHGVLPKPSYFNLEQSNRITASEADFPSGNAIFTSMTVIFFCLVGGICGWFDRGSGRRIGCGIAKTCISGSPAAGCGLLRWVVNPAKPVMHEWELGMVDPGETNHQRFTAQGSVEDQVLFIRLIIRKTAVPGFVLTCPPKPVHS